MARLLALTGALIAIALACASPATAAHVQCGDVITQDTTLDSDLVCAGDGLTVAGEVTLDLGGHTIQGSGSGVGVASFEGSVIVRDGTVRGFGAGIFADGLDSLLVEDMLARENGTGLRCEFMPQCIADHSVFEQNATQGISMSFVGEAPAAGAVVRRTVLRNNLDGNLILTTSRATVVANRIERGADGIRMDETTAHVLRNRISDAAGVGVLVSFLSHATIAGNDIERNGVAGVQVIGDFFFGNTDAVVHGNRVERNGIDGILVENAEGAPGTVIEHNHANHNADDGIDVDLAQNDPSGVDTVVRANKAYFNADLGIEAAAGTTDGGANKARHNGNPAQCVGVACR